MLKKTKPDYNLPLHTAYLENNEDQNLRTYSYLRPSAAVRENDEEREYTRRPSNETRRRDYDPSTDQDERRSSLKAVSEPQMERRFQTNRNTSAERPAVDMEFPKSRDTFRGDNRQNRTAIDGARNYRADAHTEDDTRVYRRNTVSAKPEERRYDPNRSSRSTRKQDVIEKRIPKIRNDYPLYAGDRRPARQARVSKGRNTFAIFAAGGGLVVAIALLFILLKPGDSANLAALQTPGITPSEPSVTQTDNGNAGGIPVIPTPSSTEIPGVLVTPSPTVDPTATPTTQPTATTTPYPTTTPKPTVTPKPTSTPRPTATPRPTVNPTPTPTPTVEPTPTPTPNPTPEPTPDPTPEPTPDPTPETT